jgi:hypothetical protein
MPRPRRAAPRRSRSLRPRARRPARAPARPQRPQPRGCSPKPAGARRQHTAPPRPPPQRRREQRAAPPRPRRRTHRSPAQTQQQHQQQQRPPPAAAAAPAPAPARPARPSPRRRRRRVGRRARRRWRARRPASRAPGGSAAGLRRAGGPQGARGCQRGRRCCPQHRRRSRRRPAGAGPGPLDGVAAAVGGCWRYLGCERCRRCRVVGFIDAARGAQRLCWRCCSTALPHWAGVHAAGALCGERGRVAATARGNASYPTTLTHPPSSADVTVLNLRGMLCFPGSSRGLGPRPSGRSIGVAWSPDSINCTPPRLRA